MDQTIRLATLAFDASPATRIADDATAACDRAELVGAVGAAALQAGLAARRTADDRRRTPGSASSSAGRSARSRRSSTGWPTCWLEVEPVRSPRGRVPTRWPTDADDAEGLPTRGVGLVEAACPRGGRVVQLHGGIAITWEHDAHLVFKRAHALGGCSARRGSTAPCSRLRRSEAPRVARVRRTSALAASATPAPQSDRLVEGRLPEVT